MLGQFGIDVRPPNPQGLIYMIICINGLCLSNSACNPIVYTIFSEKFRRRIVRLLGKMHGGQQHQDFKDAYRSFLIA